MGFRADVSADPLRRASKRGRLSPEKQRDTRATTNPETVCTKQPAKRTGPEQRGCAAGCRESSNAPSAAGRCESFGRRRPARSEKASEQFANRRVSSDAIV